MPAPNDVRPLAAAVLLAILAAWPSSAEGALCDGISAASASPLTTVLLASGLSRPVLALSPPGDTRRIHVLEQDGKIRLIKDGTLAAGSALDIQALTRSPLDGGGNEEGLLGLAFHPDHAANGWIFLYHTDATGGNNLVVRYTRSAADPDLFDPASRQVVLTIPHPTNTNHNGGMIAFGPGDGYLYVGTGDGGGTCDPPGNAQSGAVLLGKMLRLDVDALPYSIPPGNPFAGSVTVRNEIWALGLRNPWRWSFDRATGDLYIGDVGQNRWEEVDWQPGASPGGENYGWDLWEADVCPNPSCGSATCSVTNHRLPVHQYNSSTAGCAITGGYAYRGCRMPALQGTYFYADYCDAFIRSFRVSGGAATDLVDRTAELAPGGGLAVNLITSFGEDARGEILLVDQGGEIFKIVPILTSLEVSGPGASPFTLSADGSGSWTWEDLRATTSHPIAAYRVYRSPSRGDGTFDCIQQSPVPSWDGGDPDAPLPGQIFAYLVAAVNGAGLRTSVGTGTGGAPRSLSGLPCPP